MPTSACIEVLEPGAALPGGEIFLRGRALVAAGPLPEVRIAGLPAPVLIASRDLVVARVPEAAGSGAVELSRASEIVTAPQPLEVSVTIAENLHPVCNPAFDAEGNIVVTLSGSRGQKTPVSLFKLDANYTVRAWSSAITNPSGLALGDQGVMFASSRLDGAVYKVAANGTASLYAEGLGVATGIAFDWEGNLYVGDRSGTIFKIDRSGATFVFATLEPSIAAFHLAFGPDRYLYVSGPSTSSHDAIWKISPSGEMEVFFRGLGRPQGLAFESTGDLLVVASYRGRRGVIRITPDRRAACAVSGNNLVGLAFAPGSRPALILATTTAVHNLAWSVPGLPLVALRTGLA